VISQYIPFLRRDSSGRLLAGEARAALVTAHPGHELCLFGWLKQARPRVFILTDGSGSTGEPRLGLTTKLLTHTGAREGTIYGRLTDAQVYRAMLGGDACFFVILAVELAEIFARERFDYVACEAVEGYNPTHDVSRLITGAALARANRMSDHQTVGYEFTLIKQGRSHLEAPRGDSVWLRLDDATLGEKIETMRAHPHLRDEVSAGLDGTSMAAFRNYPELAAEVQRLVDEMGPEAFRVEHLRRVACGVAAAKTSEAPFYERYGEVLVRCGRYAQAIRFSEHLAPIAEGLRRFAAGE
jgi:hypothetical protein